MSTKRALFTVLAASAVLLALGIGSQMAGAQPPAPTQHTAELGVTIPYPGRLDDATGQPVPDGSYDFAFALYDVETDGAPLWTEAQTGVPVQGGAFQALLGSVQAIPPTALSGGDRWLEVAVRGPGEASFTALVPRQQLTAAAPAAPDSPSAGLACPHDHVGEEWTASIPWSNGAFKVLNYSNGPSIWGWNGGNGNGLRGYATGTGMGVYGESQNSTGVAGRSASGRGVEGYSTNGYGVFANSTNSDSIRVDGAGGNGVYVGSASDHGVYVASAGWSGVSVGSAAVAGVWVASANQDGVLVSTAGWDGVHVVGPVGGVYYGSGKKGDEDFAVLNTGEVRSKVGFGTPARDFAVMMDVAGDKAAYEPGDVLVAGSAGKGVMERSAVPYSPAVVGVYSAAPGFVGGQPVVDTPAGMPVAIMGIVACKVSAENGAIQPGDLLVTSATPGHAMRADRTSALPGTILGKALESLDAGTGIILVLVTLQ
ncbi:MAG: hypothetical protein KKA73_25070 [Chloroflexi bacterium]|nr:hypothetical protein [Chloroflexota bacterium]MBU1750969.1 hypothetical protein [Chloroflexota bacterium]